MEYGPYHKNLVEEARYKVRRQIVGEDRVAEELKHGEYDVPEDQKDPAGAMYGYNKSGSKYHPRLSHAHLDSMMAGTDEVHYTELCTILSRLFPSGSEQWYDYLAIRVAQRKGIDGGFGEYTVVRNVFPPFLPRSLHGKYAGTKVKKYELIQFFNDTSVVEKYNLPMKFVTSMQALAINDPESAAKTLQEKIQAQSDGVVIRVTAGRYSESRAQCLRTIKKAAVGLRDVQGATQAILVGPKCFLYEPGTGEGDGGWYVYGPIAYSQALYDIYKMVLKAGLREIAVLYAFELVKLDIYIHTGTELVATSFIANIGDTAALQFSPLRYSMLLGSALAEAKAKQVNCLPVHSGDRTVATALRISDVTIVVNSHVIETSECFVEGTKLVGGVPLGRDLWAFDLDGSSSPWKIRAPKVGEKAVLMAYTDGQVAASDDFRIDKVDGTNIYSRRIQDVAEGASGAALVSVQDGALLGIHSGLTGMYMLAIAMSPTIMSDIREWESDRVRDQTQREDLSQSVMAELDKRGARVAFMSVVENMHPLFDVSGVHVGSALNLDCKLLTTLPPGQYIVGKEATEKVTFEAYGGLYSVCCDSSLITAKDPAITRTPDTFESAVIVGMDASSPYVSRVTTVKQIVPGKRTFMLASTEGNVFPLSGGVILSMQDASVLGLYFRDSTSLDVGRLSLCASIIRDDVEAVRDDLSLFAQKFPSLGVRVWPSQVVAEVISHPSLQSDVSNLNLARIGDAAARAEMHIYFREHFYAGNQADMVAKYQSNVAFAQSAWDAGLAPLLKKQQGISFAASSKAYADMFEAFLGAVYLFETRDTFRKVCLTYGAIPSLESLDPKLLRRDSGFLGLKVPFGSALDDGTLVTPVD